MIKNGQKSTVFEKTPKIRKFWQKFWFFKKIWLLWLLIFLHFYRPPSVPDKWLLINGGEKKFKKLDFLAIFLKKSKIDPPNLVKSQWRSASIKKVTKGLFIFSPIHGRMQKIRKSYWIVFENMHGGPGPVIYGTTTRTGQGPYPALPDN